MATSKTVKASGGDYTSLAAWEAAIDGDLTGTGIAEVTCFSKDDVDRVDVDNWITTPADYIYIHTDSSAYHGGIWNGDKYNLVETNDIALAIYEDYVRVDGLQIMVASQTANSKHPVYIGTLTASANNIRLSNLIIRCSGNATYSSYAINVRANAVVYAWNLLIYGVQTQNGDCIGLFSNAAGCTVYLYSSIIIGGYYSVYSHGSGSTFNLKNIYCGGSSTEDFKTGDGTLNKTNCASEDQSADDSGTRETATNCVAAAVLIDTDTFVNVSAGTENFHLAADGLSPLQAVGVDTSGEGAPLNFTTDIDGEARDATWDIGADAVVAGGATQTLYPDAISSLEGFGGDKVNFLFPGVGGIASLEAFGTSKFTLYLLPSGIASLEEFGTDKINFTLLPSGILTTEGFGDSKLNFRLFPAGVESGEIFGSHTVTLLSGVQYLSPSSIASLEAFGSPKLNLRLYAEAVVSSEAFGMGMVRLYLQPSSVASLEAFGTAKVNFKLLIEAIQSAEAFGDLSVQWDQFLEPPGIATGESFGVLTICFPGVIPVVIGVRSAAAGLSNRAPAGLKRTAGAGLRRDA